MSVTNLILSLKTYVIILIVLSVVLIALAVTILVLIIRSKNTNRQGLVYCRYCSKPYSSELKKCPHCNNSRY